MKSLYRSRGNKIVAGICGGLAEYLELDASIVRLITVFLALAGVGVPAYIVAWIIIPLNPGETSEAVPDAGQKIVTSVKAIGKEVKQAGQVISGNMTAGESRPSKLAGIALIILGALFLLNNFVPALNIARMWPVIIILVGWALLARRR